MMRIRWIVALTLLLLGLSVFAEDKAQFYAFRANEVKPLLDKVTVTFTETPESALKQIKDMTSTSRFTNATKGDVVWIYCFYVPQAGKDVVLKIEEKPRRTLLAEQFETLIKLAQAIGAPAAAIIKVDRFQYVLQLERANLEIAASIGTAANNPPPPDRNPDWIVVVDFTNGGEATTNVAGDTTKIATGPREAYFFSADVPLSTISDVEVDEEFENVDLAETPSDFYVGLNYAPFGDALEAPRSFREAITIKGLVKASRQPSDSIGIGIGLRSGYFSASPTLRRFTMLQILDTLSPYVAYTRTRVDEEQKDDAGNVTGTLHFKRNDWTVGISLNLDKALEFVKDMGDGGEE